MFTKHCIRAIKDVTGLEASQDTGGGTSDARFMQEVCPVFEFGTINKTLHKVNECVSIEDLKTTEQIYFFQVVYYLSGKFFVRAGRNKIRVGQITNFDRSNLLLG